jgi:hypothetical protein
MATISRSHANKVLARGSGSYLVVAVSMGSFAIKSGPHATTLLSCDSGPYVVLGMGKHTVLANGSILDQHLSNNEPL